jgi:hypothetical protein
MSRGHHGHGLMAAPTDGRNHAKDDAMRSAHTFSSRPRVFCHGSCSLALMAHAAKHMAGPQGQPDSNAHVSGIRGVVCLLSALSFSPDDSVTGGRRSQSSLPSRSHLGSHRHAGPVRAQAYTGPRVHEGALRMRRAEECACACA